MSPVFKIFSLLCIYGSFSAQEISRKICCPLIAIGNDFNFKYIFSRQIEAIGNPGDIAIGITTSGNSRNIIEGIKAANKKKNHNILFFW